MLLAQLEVAGMPLEETKSLLRPWSFYESRRNRKVSSPLSRCLLYMSLHGNTFSSSPVSNKGSAPVVTSDTPASTVDVAASESIGVGSSTTPEIVASGRQKEEGPAYPWQAYAQ